MKTLFAAAVTVSMLMGTAATAYADNDRDHGRHERRHDDHGKDRRDYRGHHDDRRNWDRRDHDRRDWDRRDHERRDWDRRDHDRRYDRRDAYRAGYWNGRVDQHRYDRGRYIAPRGYYVRSWRHGDHLPRSYCETRYIVNDYGRYHLHAPPRGHHWVRVNNDVVLAAVTSGLVVSVVSGLFY